MLNFDLDVEQHGRSALITIQGDLDIQVAQRVADELRRVESSEPELLAVDLRCLSFMDSSGMGLIAAAHLRAADAGRRFIIVKPPAGVIRAFEISGLAEKITIVDDLSDAYP